MTQILTNRSSFNFTGVVCYGYWRKVFWPIIYLAVEQKCLSKFSLITDSLFWVKTIVGKYITIDLLLTILITFWVPHILFMRYIYIGERLFWSLSWLLIHTCQLTQHWSPTPYHIAPSHQRPHDPQWVHQII